MTSVVSAGTTDRIVARTLFKVLRAGSGTRARYSSTVLEVALADEARPREVDFFISANDIREWEAIGKGTASAARRFQSRLNCVTPICHSERSRIIRLRMIGGVEEPAV